MKAFAYVNPGNERDAVAAMKVGTGQIAMPIGGGQDILARMKNYITQPDRIVNIKNALDANVAGNAGGLRIGAAVKIVDLIDNAQVRRLYPAVISAAEEIGTPQIRNQGTVGGNVNQRPRCWYFRNEEFLCYKKGGNRCFAPAGENQYHAIFSTGGLSRIVHPSSLAVPFLAYNAKFRVVGSAGEREIAAADYFTLPTTPQNVLKENVLADDELMTHVILPAPGNNLKHGHYEVRYKASHDWPLTFVTVVLGMQGNTIQTARVVMGAVAPIPWRSETAEAALVGKTLNEATAIAAGEAAVQKAQPLSRNGYKLQIAKTAVKRAVMRAAGLTTV